MHRYLPVLLFVLLVAGCPQPSAKPLPPRPRPAEEAEPAFESEFERFVWLLGSSNFDKRRNAHEKLLAMGKEILPALEKAASEAKNEDHRRQIQILAADFRTDRDVTLRKDLRVSLVMGSRSFQAGKPVRVEIEIKNTGNVPLEFTAPLLRKRSVAFRLDWTADMTFKSGGREQHMTATGTKRDEWLDEKWNPGATTVKPDESLKETIDITDLCIRPARYTAVATYRWIGVGDFMSNAVSFEIVKPPAPEEEAGKNGDN